MLKKPRNAHCLSLVRPVYEAGLGGVLMTFV